MHNTPPRTPSITGRIKRLFVPSQLSTVPGRKTTNCCKYARCIEPKKEGTYHEDNVDNEQCYFCTFCCRSVRHFCCFTSSAFRNKYPDEIWKVCWRKTRLDLGEIVTGVAQVLRIKRHGSTIVSHLRGFLYQSQLSSSSSCSFIASCQTQLSKRQRKGEVDKWVK